MSNGNGIQTNLVYLCNNITNLHQILLYLEQNDIFSGDECEEISNQVTISQRNAKLLTLLQRKDWDGIRTSFLNILRRTNNDHCADQIDGISSTRSESLSHPKILKLKWWPDIKLLIKSLEKRKLGDKLLVEELHYRIMNDENRMVVICESVDASKYSGMGGVGKTLTAKWYANHYQEKYENILWIDCGEGSLLQSFKSLALELKVENWDKFTEVEDFSRECFEKLSEFKCLWIYDNAESYKGDEGILKALPKKQENFYCIITSRQRDWGTKNIGFGKISDLQLDIFREEESLSFFCANINEEIKYAEYQLKELSRLLGNLPLALQLAVAALNNGNINLHDYIERTSSRDIQSIVDEKFDDYEKTITRNINISLDLILKEKRGELAYKILMIFGYVRSDEIPSTFLLKIFHSKPNIITEAIDLLEKYSLVSKTGKMHEIPNSNRFYDKLLGKHRKEVEVDLLSIHRLLQQVIRHNGKKTEKETLRKILGCDGFVDYKLIPFSKYADECIQKEFPKVKAELLDQKKLKRLIKEKRVDEAVKLAKLINEELMTETTKFNYAICLEKYGRFEKCAKILENMFVKRKAAENEITITMEKLIEHVKANNSRVNNEDQKLLKLKNCPTPTEIWKFLMSIYLKLGKYEKALVIAKQGLVDISLIILILSSVDISNYFLKAEGGDTITLQFDEQMKKIELSKCALNLSIIPRLSPEELKLWDMSFFRGHGTEELAVIVNEFVDLEKVNRLCLDCNFLKKNISIDLSSGDICMEYLHLTNVTVLDWKQSKWTVQKLRLHDVPFVQDTQMKIKDLKIYNSSLDISCLPQTIQELNLHKSKVICSRGLELPNLKYLGIMEKRNSSRQSQSLFLPVQLTHIHLHWLKNVNLELLPASVKQVKITYENSNTVFIDMNIVGEKKLDKLILEEIHYRRAQKLLSHFQTDELVIYCSSIHPQELVDWMKTEIGAIIIGRIKWEEDEFENFIGNVNDRAEFYLIEEGKGMPLPEKDFHDVLKLFQDSVFNID